MEGLLLTMLGKYLEIFISFLDISPNITWDIWAISSSLIYGGYVRYEDPNIWVKHQIQTWIKILG